MIQRFSASRNSSIALPMVVAFAFAFALSAVLLSAPFVQSFSTPSSHAYNQRGVTDNKVSLFMDLSSASNLMSSDSSNLDRFRSVCLVGTESKEAVDEFDPELYSSLDNSESESDDDDDSDMWVAVYRSNNNKPSVVVRDDFFRAMNDATSGKNDDSNANSNLESDNDSTASNTVSTVSGAASFLSDTMPSLLEIPSTKPVAIARLIKSETSTDTKPVYLLDNLRCSLKKENQDESCDGGSEFVEALSVAVDTLLLKHLQRLLQHRQGGSDDGKAADVVFEGTVRTKATLFSGKLFEQRGFTEVEILSKDMATHVSNYEACFSKYADRTIEATMAAGTRDRALQIVALLGRLDAEVQKKVAAASSGDDDEYDPWANMQLYRS